MKSELVDYNKKWDRYDLYFFIFRFLVFAVVAAGSGFFMYNGVLYFNSGHSTLGYIAGLVYIALWLFFLIGVATYLILFTRNTFRWFEHSEEITDKDAMHMFLRENQILKHAEDDEDEPTNEEAKEYIKSGDDMK